MTTEIAIEKKVLDCISSLIETTNTTLSELENLAKKNEKELPDFLLNVQRDFQKKMESYNKINEYLHISLPQNESKLNDKLNSKECEGTYVTDVRPQGGSKLRPHSSIEHRIKSNLKPEYNASQRTRNSDTFTLSQYFQKKANNKYDNLIFVEFYPNKFVVLFASPGLSIAVVLGETMKKQNFTLEQHCLIYMQSGKLIPWTVDSTELSMSSIVVISHEGVAKYSSFGQAHSHKQHTWFHSVYCKLCHKLTTRGFRCENCHASYHKKCLINNACDNICTGKPDKTNPSKSIKLGFFGFFNRTHSPNPNIIPQKPCFFDRNESDVESDDESWEDSKDYTLNELLSLAESTQSENNDVDIRIVEIDKNKQPSCRLRRTPVFQRPVKVNDWSIDINEVGMGPMIGSGTFGTVYKAKWHGNVAIKMIKVKKPDKDQLDAFKNEIMMLRFCRHTNIIMFMGCISEPVWAIVTQWCNGDTLYKHIHVLETDWNQKEICDFANQIAEGMAYLHDRNITHRDLKSNNIFILEKSEVKIGDFGLATIKDAAVARNVENGVHPAGSVLWMAPEIIRMDDTDPYSQASDVYAYGIVLYELLSYSLPYYNINNIDSILYMVGKGIIKPDFSIILDSVNKKLVKLCQRCIGFNPDSRPMFSEIVLAVLKAFYIVPIIERTTSCLQLNDESALNISQSSINMIKNSYLIPSYINNLREAHSSHDIEKKFR